MKKYWMYICGVCNVFVIAMRKGGSDTFLNYCKNIKNKKGGE
jgi:hypothetical protein